MEPSRDQLIEVGRLSTRALRLEIDSVYDLTDARAALKCTLERW